MKNMSNIKANRAVESREYATQGRNLADQKIGDVMTMIIRELNPKLTIETDFLRDHVAPMQLGSLSDATKTAKGIADYCAEKKLKKFDLGDLMTMAWSSGTPLTNNTPTFEPEDMAGLVIGEMEDSDFNPEMSEECHDHLVAFFFDEGKKCCTFGNAQFVARRILCESRILGSEYVFNSDDFSESQGGYSPSEEAWDKYIEPQTALKHG